MLGKDRCQLRVFVLHDNGRQFTSERRRKNRCSRTQQLMRKQGKEGCEGLRRNWVRNGDEGWEM
jgi:hypothetical protein